MEIVQVLDKKFSIYISKEQIKERVKEVASEIEKDLKDKNFLVREAWPVLRSKKA